MTTPEQPTPEQLPPAESHDQTYSLAASLGYTALSSGILALDHLPSVTTPSESIVTAAILPDRTRIKIGEYVLGLNSAEIAILNSALLLRGQETYTLATLAELCQYPVRANRRDLLAVTFRSVRNKIGSAAGLHLIERYGHNRHTVYHTSNRLALHDATPSDIQAAAHALPPPARTIPENPPAGQRGLTPDQIRADDIVSMVKTFRHHPLVTKNVYMARNRPATALPDTADPLTALRWAGEQAGCDKKSFPGLFKLLEQGLQLYRSLPADHPHTAAHIETLAAATYAYESLFLQNQGLVWHIARRYRHVMPLEDLILCGNEGLAHAISRFDLDKSVAFSTYAVHWIAQSIRRNIIKTARQIRLPEKYDISWQSLLRHTSLLREKLSRDPTEKELAEASNMTVHTIRYLRAFAPVNGPSLDDPIGPSGERCLGDTAVVSENYVEAALDTAHQRQTLATLIQTSLRAPDKPLGAEELFCVGLAFDLEPAWVKGGTWQHPDGSSLTYQDACTVLANKQLTENRHGGMRYVEMGRLLGISAREAEWHVRRALQKLAKAAPNGLSA